MLSLRYFARPVVFFVTTAVLSMTLYMPAAHAARVSTEQLMGAEETTAARTKIELALLRIDVQQALLEQGVNLQDVQARVAALSDQEAVQMASQMDQLPAGGDGLGTLVFLFLVLIILDVLCLTKIFPFTVKHCR
jgi:hypothetical protein